MFDDPSGVDAPTVGEEGWLGDTHQTVDNDTSFKRRLDNFTKTVVRKRAFPLIR